MALDKLVDSTQLDSDLTSVANAIRAKSGGSGQLAFPAGFVSEIQGITGGWTTDGIIAGTEPAGAIVSDKTKIRTHLFYNNNGITSVSLPLCTAIETSAFYGCSNMLSFSAPIHQSFYQKNNAFQGCSKCTLFHLPRATIIGTSQFQGCSALPALALPNATDIYNLAFKDCTNLEVADFGNAITRFLRDGLFENDTKLATLVLRRSGAIVPLSYTTAFKNTPFASGKAGGTIYIPKALYDHLGDGTALDYQAATNWSTVHGYGTITWAKIEGSIYENQYADGTAVS